MTPSLAETVKRLNDECYEHHAEDIKTNSKCEHVPSLNRSQVDRFKLMSALVSVLDELERVTGDLATAKASWKAEVIWQSERAEAAEAKVTSLERELADLRKAAETHAIYSLQTNCYPTDLDFRDATDAVINLTIKRAHSPAAKEAE